MISILYALIYLCEGYIFFYYTNHIFTRRKKGLLVSASCIVCGYLMNYLVSFQNNTLLNVILFLTVNALLIYLLYQTGPVSAIFHSLLLCILMGGSELIILNTVLKLAFDFQPDQRSVSSDHAHNSKQAVLFSSYLSCGTAVSGGQKILRKQKTESAYFDCNSSLFIFSDYYIYVYFTDNPTDRFPELSGLLLLSPFAHHEFIYFLVL